MKVAINACFGGFSLSPEATLEIWKRGGAAVEATPVAEYFGADRDPNSSLGRNHQLREWREYLLTPAHARRQRMFVTVFTPDESAVLNNRTEKRDDPVLVQVIEEMGEVANGSCAKLRIVEVPDDAEWEIAEYDGNEHVAEKHRSWS